jgi:hypothetical protein
LRIDTGVKLAIVPSDVYPTLLDDTTSGNPAAAELLKPLRVMRPLKENDTQRYRRERTRDVHRATVKSLFNHGPSSAHEDSP